MTRKDPCAGIARVMSKQEFRRGYVTGHYPNLCGYAYQADMISIREAERIMEKILKETVCIEDPPRGHPVLHQKNGEELSVQDTEDFPQPADDCEGYDVDEED